MSNEEPPKFELGKISFSLRMSKMLERLHPDGFNTNYVNDNLPEKSKELDYKKIAKFYYNKLDALLVSFKQGLLQLEEEELRKLQKLKGFFESALYVAESDEYVVSDEIALIIIDLAKDYVFKQFIKELESRT